jgi:hypothetical protein
MLIVGAKPYRGRYRDKAVALVKSGVRVGEMWVSGHNDVHCHVCDIEFEPPHFEDGHIDHWGYCPSCQTPFIFRKV